MTAINFEEAFRIMEEAYEKEVEKNKNHEKSALMYNIHIRSLQVELREVKNEVLNK